MTTIHGYKTLNNFISSSLAAVKAPAANSRRAITPDQPVSVFWVDLLRHPRGCDVIRLYL
jgi:hypothetical protein